MVKMSSKYYTAVLFLWLLIHKSLCCCATSKTDGPQNEVNIGEEVATVGINEKVWLFAVDGVKRPYSFLDRNGVLVGFDVDLISKVCGLVKKKCKLVLSQFPECTITNRNINYPGRGLMSNWFDGCPGYVLSVDREAAFDFTEPYLATEATFTVAPGNPSQFDPDSDDYSGFTLTHLNGAVTNAQCLTRLKKKFGNIIIATDLSDAKSLLLNKTVLPQRVHCDKGGAGIMLKKGSQLSTWWNPAFKTFVLKRGYANLCAESEMKYNATINCLPSLKSHYTKVGLLSKENSEFKYEIENSKVWLFAVSGRRKPFNYLDDQGKLTGFDVDFVNAVCSIANKKCVSVVVEFTECTFTQRNINYPGRGLMDGWFDACTGYVDTLDRENGFDFTDAYLRSDATYSVIPGNPSRFNPEKSDFSNFTFVHLTGAFTNAECLNKLNKKFGKIIIADNTPHAKALLFSREADVLFSPHNYTPDLETLPARVHCERTGTSIMVKKGSPLVDWWNLAFRSFVDQGLYDQLCHEGRRKYQYPIACFTFLSF